MSKQIFLPPSELQGHSKTIHNQSKTAYTTEYILNANCFYIRKKKEKRDYCHDK